MNSMTAAHRSLPFGSIVRIKNRDNGKSMLVRINDRGPFVKSRVIDLSLAAAKETQSLGQCRISIEGLDAEKILVSKSDPSNSLFCYSTEKPLICKDKYSMEILDSTSNFDDVYDMYKSYMAAKPDKDVYIAVTGNYYSDGGEGKFYIAVKMYDVRDMFDRDKLAKN
jgi:rare lipoprotein A